MTETASIVASEPPLSLDGEWDFFPGDHELPALERLDPRPIRVPGLWEAQGYVELDGPAWYRRRFDVDDSSGFWTLRFGAVMDLADVYLNGVALGSHDTPFTPFELDATTALAPGENVLAVRVDDPPLGHPDHARMPHGKEGWGNRAFPSPPSIYLTYGGIWQPVTLKRHGPVLARDVFVSGDPDDLVVAVNAVNRSDTAQHARVWVRTLDVVQAAEAELAPRERRTLVYRLGGTSAARWRPEEPVLHEAAVEVEVEGASSDVQRVRYGLRTIRIEGGSILVGDVPYRMKSALVQGFRADELYAEGGRDAIRDEVLAAKAMGFNTLRLHIKAFDPAYLDICDEVGMLLHCDLPVAEPLAYDELGADTPLARRCVAAIGEQVRRDRNHPSVVLWSAMNEIGIERDDVRQTPAYEEFARTLVAAVREADPTRPVIENDWTEPSPERVFSSPVLTAHWYGRLHRDYLDELERNVSRWAGLERPLYVSEYGDWGLPAMPERAEPPFWDTRELYVKALARTPWPESFERFLAGTQRYQGISDRLQTEIFRRHDHIGGYCVTELTDVPHELNGLLDLERRPKAAAVEEMARANQPVLPMLELPSLVVEADGRVRAPLHVANDGPGLADVDVEVALGGASQHVPVGDLPPYRPKHVADLEIAAPSAPGEHDLVLRLRAGSSVVAQNRYPIHVVARGEAAAAVRLVGGGAAAAALEAIGARIADRGPTVVGEDALDATVAPVVRERLSRGEAVLLLAQAPEAAASFPLPARMVPVETRWGSTDFRFTTDDEALSALPRRAVLAAEDATLQVRAVVAEIGGRAFPERALVAVFKPDPGALTGTLVGVDRVGDGRLVFSQYRLAERAVAGDAAARALLAELVRLAAA